MSYLNFYNIPSQMNSKVYLHSKNKSSELGTILQQSYLTHSQGLTNSQKFSLMDLDTMMMADSIRMSNTSQINQNSPSFRNRSGIFVTSPRHREVSSPTSGRHRETSPTSGLQVVTINNRKFVKSKSPPNNTQSQNVHPLKPYKPTINNKSEVYLKNSAILPQSGLTTSKQLTSKRYQQLESEQIKKYRQMVAKLQKRVRQVEEQKKNSIVNLLKQRLNLKDQIDRRVQQCAELKQIIKIKQQLIQKLSSQIQQQPSDNQQTTTNKLLQMQNTQHIQNLKEHNAQYQAQIEALTQKLKQHNKIPNQYYISQPIEIQLPKTEDSINGSQVTMVIGANWQHLLQNGVLIQKIGYEQSHDELREDTQQYNIDEIIHNIHKLTKQNEQLKLQNAQLLNKIEQQSQKILQQEGQLEIKDLIAIETAKAFKDISSVVIGNNQNQGKSMKRIKQILQQVGEGGECQQNGSIIQHFLSSYS